MTIQLNSSCPAQPERKLTTANSPAMKAARQALRWTLPLVVFRMTPASATTTAWQPTPWCPITCTQAAASARINTPGFHVAAQRQRHSQAHCKVHHASWGSICVAVCSGLHTPTASATAVCAPNPICRQLKRILGHQTPHRCSAQTGGIAPFS